MIPPLSADFLALCRNGLFLSNFPSAFRFFGRSTKNKGAFEKVWKKKEGVQGGRTSASVLRAALVGAAREARERKARQPTSCPRVLPAPCRQGAA